MAGEIRPARLLRLLGGCRTHDAGGVCGSR